MDRQRAVLPCDRLWSPHWPDVRCRLPTVRPLLLLGCTLIVLGMATLSLAKVYWHVFLSRALCMLVSGRALSSSPPSRSSQRYFRPQPDLGLSAAPTRVEASVVSSSRSCCVALYLRSVSFRQYVLSLLSTSFVRPWPSLTLAIIASAPPARLGPTAPHRTTRIDPGAFREIPFMPCALALLFNY